MNWITVYITGRDGFGEELRKKLSAADIHFMPGYLQETSYPINHELYWIEDTTELRAFKKAVGSKSIWKYRMRFYVCLEDFIRAAPKMNVNSLTQEVSTEEKIFSLK